MTDNPPLLPGFEPTPMQRKIIDAAVDISDCDANRPEFQHAVLCQVGLPRSKPAGSVFERSNGKASILVEAGKLHKAGQWVDMGLPYGAKPRLALIHLCSEATRTGERQIYIGETICEFLRMLDLPTNGPSYAEMRRQMERLAACHMMLGMSNGLKDVTIDAKPIRHFEAWLQLDEGQRVMWPGYLELTAEFMESLMGHAVPLDPRAIRALKKSALALDVYTWLAHRLCRVRKDTGVKLSWRNLRAQFGQEYAYSKDFKREFKTTLFKVRAVYPAMNIEEIAGGILLKPSPPPIPKKQVVVKLPQP